MHVAVIRIYPVKSLRGIELRRADVEPWGLAGDRRWMVVDAAGRFLTQREHAAMARIAARPVAGGLRVEAGPDVVDVPEPGPEAEEIAVTVWRDTVRARVAGAEVAALLSAAIGQPCRLVWLHDPQARATDPAHAPPGSTVSFADGFPLLLTSEASLADLNARLASPVTSLHFRPNVVVAGAPPWAEDRWRRVRIGRATFAVVKPCERCIVTTIDPETGERPDRSEPLRALARFRRDVRGGVMFGQNLVPVDATGAIAVGDAVEVLEEGAPNVQLG